MSLSHDGNLSPPTVVPVPQIHVIPGQHACEHHPELWESKKSEIERLYVDKDLKLERVMELMAESGFHATYVYSLPHW
jgi:hypothetical protein